MSKKTRINDPHAEREAANYESPIASREFILDIFNSSQSSWTLEQLYTQLHFTDEEQQIALQRRLLAMVRVGQLSQPENGTFTLPNNTLLIAGKVVGNKDGYGFVIPDDKSEDLYLHFREMRKVFEGDRVLAAIINRDKKGKLEGEIIEVTERNTHKVVGKLFIEGEKLRVVPDNPKIQHSIFIDQNFTINAKHDDL